MKEGVTETLGVLTVDIDIHYDLDMTKFPGVDDPDCIQEPTLLLPSQKMNEAWFDAITQYDEPESDEEECDVDDSDTEPGDDGCVFCDALVSGEDNDSDPITTKPCYSTHNSPRMLYFFNDSHLIEYETVEIMEGEHPTESIHQGHEGQGQEFECTTDEKTYWLNSSNQDNCIQPSEHEPAECVITDLQDTSYTQLTPCQYVSDSNSSHQSQYMDTCITEQLPLFIDLVDELSPFLSPSGHVRSRKGDNSMDQSVSDDEFRYFLASDEGLMTIDTSNTSISHKNCKNATIFPRGS
ncbi:uncharacterized protein [Haliotis cracherodii]|uniref:uncharacterized protein n=1 Tax=Haliotis cracherodii TaxID=6455 RepID=UPI0039E7EFD4